MPVASIAEARNEVMDHFVTAWNAQTPPVPLLLFDDKQQPGVPDPPAPYARIVMRHNDRDRVTLADETGNRRFRSFGIITVQIFSVSGDGLTANDTFVNVAVNAFEGAKTGLDRVTFRNVRSNEIGEDGPWFQTNVIAEFDYDVVK